MLSYNGQVKLTQKEENEMRQRAALQGRVMKPVKNVDDLLVASLQGLDEETLTVIEDILDEVCAQFGLSQDLPW